MAEVGGEVDDGGLRRLAVQVYHAVDAVGNVGGGGTLEGREEFC